MARDFSIIRRRKNLMDILIPRVNGVGGYQFETASNFDGSFTARFTASFLTGYIDPNLSPTVLASQPVFNNNNQVRCLFDPATFLTTDNSVFWARITPVVNGTPGTPGSPHMIRQYSTEPKQMLVVSGNAPNGAALANSLELVLPFSVQSIDISNLQTAGGNNLFVAFEPDGVELRVAAASTFSNSTGTFNSLFVRGSGSTVAFQATIMPHSGKLK